MTKLKLTDRQMEAVKQLQKYPDDIRVLKKRGVVETWGERRNRISDLANTIIKMKIIYQTNNFGNPIEEVECDKETQHSVWIKGKNDRHFSRSAKQSHYHCCFNTFEEAKQFLVDRKEKEIEREENNLHGLKSELGQLKSLKPKS